MQLQEKLIHFKHYYIDPLDPEGATAKLAFRTALACMINIFLFQLLGNPLLSAWAGFGSFAFVQNDTKENFKDRVLFLSSIVLLFTGLAFLGMLLGNSAVLFLCTLPFIVFIFAYIACLGFSYFNASGWALFMYIFAAGNPSSLNQAGKTSAVLLISGVVSIAVCFLIFPMRRYKKTWLGFEKIFYKIIVLFDASHEDPKKLSILFNQLDRLSILQEKNLIYYINSRTFQTRKQENLMLLSKLIHQLCLSSKATILKDQQIKNYTFYPEAPIKACSKAIESSIMHVIEQIKFGKPVFDDTLSITIANFRDEITQIRKNLQLSEQSKFDDVLDISDYLYHIITISRFLNDIVNCISALQVQHEA